MQALELLNEQFKARILAIELHQRLSLPVAARSFFVCVDELSVPSMESILVSFSQRPVCRLKAPSGLARLAVWVEYWKEPALD